MLQRRQRDNLLIPCVANVVAHARLNGGGEPKPHATSSSSPHPLNWSVRKS